MDGDGRVLYLVVSGAPAPEGVPALVTACQAAGWRVVVFSTPAGTSFIDPAELEQLTGEPVRSEYRMPGTGASVPAAAGQSGDPLLAAASAWRMSYMITGRKHPREALDLAMAAAAALERKTRKLSPERLSVYGALHLAARHGRSGQLRPGHSTIAAGHRPRHRRPHWRGEPPGHRVRPG